MRITLTLIVAALAAPATAQTITVTTSADAVNIPPNATIADLPGSDGVVSFREALRVSDNVPGRQTIGFAIPESDWYLPNIVPGRVLLQGSFSFSASQPVIIDGTTQTAFTGDTHADGNELVIPLQTYLNGGDSIVTGLDGTRVELGGAGNEVHTNTGGMDIRFVLATDSVAHDNEADNINIAYSSDCLVVRNVTERVRVTGLGAGSPAANNVIGGPNPEDRNYITGFGNYGEHGVPAGTTVELYYTRGTIIENNYIGATPDGMSIANDASTVGIGILNRNDDLTIRDNLIAILAHGVFPIEGVPFGQPIYFENYGDDDGPCRNIEIVGNTLGLNALGEPVLGGVRGIWVSRYAFEYCENVNIEANVIAGHLETGVLMEYGPGAPAAGGVRLSANSIYANGELGIDLMPNTWDFGQTPNDPMDVDVGANGLQNFPVLTSAVIAASTVIVEGTLQSLANQAFVVEIFSSPACDPSGFGQGHTYLGSTAVLTSASGDAAFSVSLPASDPTHTVVTATATRSSTGDTSEFSACRAVVGASCPADLAEPFGQLDFSDVVSFLDAFSSAQPEADLAEPLGQFDFSDVVSFLAAFAAGCP